MDKILMSLVTEKLQFESVRSSSVKAKRPKNDPSTYLIEIFKKDFSINLFKKKTLT